MLNRLSGRSYGKVFLGYPIVRQPFAYNREPRRVYVWSPADSEGGLYAIHTADDTIAYEDVTFSNGDARTVEVERQQNRSAGRSKLSALFGLSLRDPARVF